MPPKPFFRRSSGVKADIISVRRTDLWRGYDGLVDVGLDKHLRVNHGNNEFARGSVHVNGIESFWSYAKRPLVQFNGVPRHTFYLHLKETEFRFSIITTKTSIKPCYPCSEAARFNHLCFLRPYAIALPSEMRTGRGVTTTAFSRRR